MAQGKTHLTQLANALSPATYAWRNSNSITLLINAEMFFPHMIDGIKSAKQTILLEMYLVESGSVASRFIEACLVAATKGVKIHLLFDDFGCRGLKQADRNKLVHENISLAFYNPLHYGTFRRNLFRDHRKILVIDNKQAYIGGVGLTDDFVDKDAKKLGWRETVICIKGQCVLDWIDAFTRVWEFYAKTSLSYNYEAQEAIEENIPCRVNCTVGSAKQGIKRSLIKRIRATERQCWIATAYFVPSYKVRRALARAAKRGVDVRVLVPGPKTDHPAVRHAGRRFYYRLLKAGVRIYEYQPRFMHQKVLLCDSWVSIGSSNIDRWNFRWNLEANQEVEDQDFVSQVEKMFSHDFSQSKECKFDEWEQRSFYNRLMEKLWGYVDRVIDRFLR